jgi:hypothetical protein
MKNIKKTDLSSTFLKIDQEERGETNEKFTRRLEG